MHSFDNDPFFKDFNKGAKKAGAVFGLFAIIAVVANVAFWAGLIYFIFWCLQHFGVI